MEIWGHVGQLGGVAIKSLLLFLTAVVGFRIAGRRTIAEMNAFDFLAAVAAGAVIGRVPNATSTSYVEGAVTLVVVLAAHAGVARLRFVRPIAFAIDHPPSLLIVDGQPRRREMRRAALTTDDLHAILRQSGVHSLAEVRFLVFESRGRMSLVRTGEASDELVEELFWTRSAERAGLRPPPDRGGAPQQGPAGR
ncbi:MAG: DUF421 domain-containing protein [Acidimicrobiales bacterium]